MDKFFLFFIFIGVFIEVYLCYFFNINGELASKVVGFSFLLVIILKIFFLIKNGLFNQNKGK